MALSREMQELLARVRQEVENAICSPPSWALDRVKEELVGAMMKSVFNQKLAESVAKAIAKEFSQAVVLSVTQEFHRIAADEVAHGMRGLACEMAQIRAIIRQNIDSEDWWKQGPDDTDEQDGQKDPPAE